MALEQKAGVDRILTPEAIEFVTKLHREFNPRRQELLARRERVKREIDAGKLPDFLAETRSIRDREWRVAPIPKDLLEHVEDALLNRRPDATDRLIRFAEQVKGKGKAAATEDIAWRDAAKCESAIGGACRRVLAPVRIDERDLGARQEEAAHVVN